MACNKETYDDQHKILYHRHIALDEGAGHFIRHPPVARRD